MDEEWTAGSSPLTERVSAPSVLLDQAAQLLGVSKRTLYYRIREGRLRTIRTRCGSQRVLLSSIRDLDRDRAATAGRPVPPAPWTV